MQTASQIMQCQTRSDKKQKYWNNSYATAKKRKVKWYGLVIGAYNLFAAMLQGTKEEEADRGDNIADNPTE